MKNPAIIFKRVSKSFNLNREDKLKNRLVSFLEKPQRFWALKDVSFTIRPREIVGFYGPNGSGKTVIFKLIAGIMQPDSGHIQVHGKVASIIELGASLHPELSGLDNIFLYSAILGVSKQEVNKNLKDIIEFSELGRFIHVSVKKYSSGMKARLGFSIAIFSNPDILLVDEVFAVGDRSFQMKCLERIKELSKRVTILLTSHNLRLLNDICDRIIQMSKINRAISPPNVFKLLESLPVGFSFKLEATSSSMLPTIGPGNLLLIKKIPLNQVKENDVVAFFDNTLSDIIVHRVKKVATGPRGCSLITKGDMADLADPWKISRTSFIGKVIKVIERGN
ncbi:hypothetical protein COU95_00410 [Candidatus Shapirobacteria bacterium CG10_big_fil_rev_8_21_14_0_10_40_9]|uniref:ABC transporter domain-containing protein n=1 Tax=Candidatus Shapirobacteria bacterium CG10_big_fil_rev_8_21_14_0_10_40_9 TaxID=1974888 RepID=A0A2M8L4I7_9BACT|nr:MAG: hypothetical protein COU95_00410 [Candidatus Shapirobacteria bacterium CG10_big_fil_rev_8_21_14_0_10_40_9]